MTIKNTAQQGVGEIEIIIFGGKCHFILKKRGNVIKNTHPG
jgi:hypothetical protein